MIVSKTPLRASFFGGGTDFHEYFHNSKYGYGCVVSTSIKMYIYIIVNKRFDDKIRLVYQGNELVDSVDEIKHNIIREALKITGIEKGIEILYLADLPMTNLGLGLASSSALSVGVLNALHAYKGDKVTKEQLAKEAIDIEINRLGQQIGIQDQYAVAFGGFNKYTFYKDDTVGIEPIKLKNSRELLDNLMFFYTGQARDSKQIFVEQKKTTENKKEILDGLIEIAEEAMQCIKDDNFLEFGRLLDKSWKIKKKFASGVSNELIDTMYSLAMDNGALGGKILGAGGGGFLLLYVPKNRQNKVRKALKDYKEVEIDFDNNGSQIVYSD